MIGASLTVQHYEPVLGLSCEEIWAPQQNSWLGFMVFHGISVLGLLQQWKLLTYTAFYIKRDSWFICYALINSFFCKSIIIYLKDI